MLNSPCQKWAEQKHRQVSVVSPVWWNIAPDS